MLGGWDAVISSSLIGDRLLLERINTRRLSFPPRIKCGINRGGNPEEHWMPPANYLPG